MTLEGTQLMGQKAIHGAQSTIIAVNPATGEALETQWPGGRKEDVEQACQLAWQAFDS